MRLITLRSAILCAAVALLGVMTPASSQTRMPQAPLAASPNYKINWSAIGEMSSQRSASSSYRLDAVIGQTTAGRSAPIQTYYMCDGYLCVLDNPIYYRLYLPVIYQVFR